MCMCAAIWRRGSRGRCSTNWWRWRARADGRHDGAVGRRRLRPCGARGLEPRRLRRTADRSALDPLERGVRAARGRSDFDLNPDAPRLDRPLRPAAVLIPVVDRDGRTDRAADPPLRHPGQPHRPDRLARRPARSRRDGWEAALREADEEVGLRPDHVEPLGLSDAYETGTGFLVTPVVGWVRPGFTLTTDPGEVADIFETPWDFLMDRGQPPARVYDAPDGTRRWFWAMPCGERYIWGATAGMLRSLWGRLRRPGARGRGVTRLNDQPWLTAPQTRAVIEALEAAGRRRLRALRRRLRAQRPDRPARGRHRHRHHPDARGGDRGPQGGGPEGRAHGAGPRHGDGDLRAVSRTRSPPCAATSPPTGATPRWPSPTTGPRTPSGATSA